MCIPQYWKWMHSRIAFESIKILTISGRKDCVKGGNGQNTKESVLETVNKIRQHLDLIEKEVTSTQ